MTNNNNYEVHVCSICGDVADTIVREGIDTGYHCMRCNHTVRDSYCDDWTTETFVHNGLFYEAFEYSYVCHFVKAGLEVSAEEFCDAMDEVKRLFAKYNEEMNTYKRSVKYE